MSLRLGVVGHPIGHSMSPGLFRKLFSVQNVEDGYCWISAHPGMSLRKLMDRLQLDGVNVTSPFKEVYYVECDRLSAMSQRLGCVNTVRREGKELVGHNTDPEGVVHMLNTHHMTSNIRHAVVLGAGGAARAAIAGLAKAGYSVTVMNRSVEKAKCLATEFNTQFAMWGAGFEVRPGSLLLSCLPPRSELPKMNWDALSVVMDATYAHSPIQSLCLALGIPYVNGRHWLVGQAVGSYEYLTGRTCPLRAEELFPLPERINPKRLVPSHQSEEWVGKPLFELLVCVGENLDAELALLAHETHILQQVEGRIQRPLE